MIDGLLIFAVFSACLGAFRRGEDGRLVVNATAMALLASVATTCLLVWLEMPFNLGLWLALDLAVIGAILLTAQGWADWLVLALFVPAWAFYGTPVANEATTIIVSAQLLLTFPAAAVWRRIKQAPRVPDKWNEFDLRAAHGAAGV